MGLFSLLNHLLNFLAPAFAVAVGVVLCSQIFMRKRARPHGWIAPIALNFTVGAAVLAAGLALRGYDGGMLTYAALTLACALCQWLWLRGWRD
jgi:hypothetical protein